MWEKEMNQKKKDRTDSTKTKQEKKKRDSFV